MWNKEEIKIVDIAEPVMSANGRLIELLLAS